MGELVGPSHVRVSQRIVERRDRVRLGPHSRLQISQTTCVAKRIAFHRRNAYSFFLAMSDIVIEWVSLNDDRGRRDNVRPHEWVESRQRQDVSFRETVVNQCPVPEDWSEDTTEN